MPSAPTLALSAAIGLSVGLGLVWLTFKAPPPGMTSEREVEQEADPADAEAEAEAEAEADADVDVDVEADAEADAEAEAEPDADSDRVARRAEPTLRFRRGRVAYIRCGALERCSRDRVLEDAVWEVLEALPTCPDGPRSAGQGDVRVHFGGEGLELRFRDWGDAPLALPPLRACLESAVSRLTTRLGVRPLTVSFRFELRPLG